VIVHRSRDELLARAVLAGDEHAARRRGGLGDLVEDRAHRGALADHREVRARPTSNPLVLAREPRERQGVLDRDQELVARERLLDEVMRAALGRLDRGVDRRVARHHDDDRLGLGRPELGQDLEARLARHHDVQEDHVDVVLDELGEPGGGAACNLDRVALQLEGPPDGRQDVGLVIDDENRAARHARDPTRFD